MTSKNFLRKGLRRAIPMFGALYVAACGGTATLEGGGFAGQGTGGTSSSGGSTSMGGKGSVAGAPQCDLACPGIGCGPGEVSYWDGCCTMCKPAGSGGATGTAGSGAGGSGAVAGFGGCGVVQCPAIACGSGYTLTTVTGECCPTCVPDNDGGVAGVGGGCNDVSCPLVLCAQGYTEVPDGCCSMCVPDSQACTAGQQGYATLRASLLQQSGATSCMSDGDCTTLPGVPQCGDTCVATTVSTLREPDMANQLNLWAKSYCSSCTAIYPPCAVPPTPFCSGGQCQLYHPL